MKRCQAKFPGTTAFYLHGTQCGCSPTKSGPCKIKAHSAYVAYEIRTLKLRRLACVSLWNDSYALQYQQRWLNSFVVIWDEHCYCCETHTHTHSVSLSLTHTLTPTCALSKTRMHRHGGIHDMWRLPSWVYQRRSEGVQRFVRACVYVFVSANRCMGRVRLGKLA